MFCQKCRVTDAAVSDLPLEGLSLVLELAAGGGRTYFCCASFLNATVRTSLEMIQGLGYALLFTLLFSSAWKFSKGFSSEDQEKRDGPFPPFCRQKSESVFLIQKNRFSMWIKSTDQTLWRFLLFWKDEVWVVVFLNNHFYWNIRSFMWFHWGEGVDNWDLKYKSER